MSRFLKIKIVIMIITSMITTTAIADCQKIYQQEVTAQTQHPVAGSIGFFYANTLYVMPLAAGIAGGFAITEAMAITGIVAGTAAVGMGIGFAVAPILIGAGIDIAIDRTKDKNLKNLIELIEQARVYQSSQKTGKLLNRLSRKLRKQKLSLQQVSQKVLRWNDSAQACQEVKRIGQLKKYL